jgi:single-strand DNA-binding protein
MLRHAVGAERSLASVDTHQGGGHGGCLGEPAHTRPRATASGTDAAAARHNHFSPVDPLQNALNPGAPHTMASVNKVILIGNCGRDPEVRYATSGAAICNISIATSSRRKDKTSGESIETTEWHRVTFYDRLAEIAGEYLKKGRPVYVEGRLKYGKYTDKDGVERNTVDIVASEMQLLGGREGGGGGMGGPDEGGSSAPPQRSAPAQRPAGGNAPAGKPAAKASHTGFDDMDDDIPF